MNTVEFLSLNSDAQQVLLAALFASGYPLRDLLAAQIVPPEGRRSLHGVWKVQTGEATGFALNVSRADVARILLGNEK